MNKLLVLFIVAFTALLIILQGEGVQTIFLTQLSQIILIFIIARFFNLFLGVKIDNNDIRYKGQFTSRDFKALIKVATIVSLATSSPHLTSLLESKIVFENKPLAILASVMGLYLMAYFGII